MGTTDQYHVLWAWLFMEAVRQRAIQDGRRKVVQTSAGELALFDLLEDPGELHPEAAESDPEALELLKRLQRTGHWTWKGSPMPQPSSESGTGLDPEAYEALRALGYLE